MGYDLSGKVALVTGGSRGIGAAIAERLAADGAAVMLTYNSSPDAANEVVARIEKSGGKAKAVKADASDPAACAQCVTDTVEAFGGLDILVNNAGIAVMGRIQDTSVAEYDKQFAVNVRGVVATTHEALKHMPDGSRIINISSIAAKESMLPGAGHYAGSKGAVSQLTKGWARDLGKKNILVNAVQPGPIDTDMNPADGGMAHIATPMTALKRYGKPEEVAALVAFLASTESSYITGECITIDGGQTC